MNRAIPSTKGPFIRSQHPHFQLVFYKLPSFVLKSCPHVVTPLQLPLHSLNRYTLLPPTLEGWPHDKLLQGNYRQDVSSSEHGLFFSVPFYDLRCVTCRIFYEWTHLFSMKIDVNDCAHRYARLNVGNCELLGCGPVDFVPFSTSLNLACFSVINHLHKWQVQVEHYNTFHPNKYLQCNICWKISTALNYSGLFFLPGLFWSRAYQYVYNNKSKVFFTDINLV